MMFPRHRLSSTAPPSPQLAVCAACGHGKLVLDFHQLCGRMLDPGLCRGDLYGVDYGTDVTFLCATGSCPTEVIVHRYTPTEITSNDVRCPEHQI